MPNNCIFCKIAENQSPATVEYKDKKITIFQDINPKAPVHLLIIPNKHIETFNEFSEEDSELLTHMMFKAREVAEMKGIAKDGYRLQMNVEKGGGQVVFHVHLHLLGGKQLES